MVFKINNEYYTEPVVPVLLAHLGDTPECTRASGIYGGCAAKVAKPCWTCEVPGSELNSLKSYPPRDFQQLHSKLKSWLDMMNSTDSAIREQAHREAKKESMTLLQVCPPGVALYSALLQNSYQGIWYIVIPYFLTTCNEHYLAGGIGKKLVKILKDIIKLYWDTAASHVIAFIDQSFITFADKRHPGVNSFPNGIFGILCCTSISFSHS